jgi:hypothetical protein
MYIATIVLAVAKPWGYFRDLGRWIMGLRKPFCDNFFPTGCNNSPPGSTPDIWRGGLGLRYLRGSQTCWSSLNASRPFRYSQNLFAI